MKLFLVRHAQAQSAPAGSKSAGAGALRPLTEAGERHSEALAEFLADEGIERLVCGTALRCQQTLEALTLETAIPVEIDERLDADESVQRMLELMPSYGEGAVVFCTHQKPIQALLRVFELGSDDATAVPCRKGSIWVLEGPGYTPTTARYLEPTGRRKRDRLRFPSEKRESIRAATLDLGSTSFNLLIADIAHGSDLRPVIREKVMLRLGAVIAEHSRIPEDVCESALDVARELREVAEREKVQRFYPVGTAALRDADNGAEVAERIGRTLGTPVRILSGEEEARIIFRAFWQRLPLRGERVLGIDLGGGSLEIVAGGDHGIEYEATLRLGVARLHQELVTTDPMRRDEAKSLRKYVRDALAPEAKALKRFEATRIVATGGTIRSLARLADEERAGRGETARVSGKLSRKRIANLCDELLPTTHEERLLLRGIQRRRADLLPAGAIILQEIVKAFDIGSMTICDWGLREGVLLEAHSGESP